MKKIPGTWGLRGTDQVYAYNAAFPVQDKKSFHRWIIGTGKHLHHLLYANCNCFATFGRLYLENNDATEGWISHSAGLWYVLRNCVLTNDLIRLRLWCWFLWPCDYWLVKTNGKVVVVLERRRSKKRMLWIIVNPWLSWAVSVTLLQP